MKQVAIGLILPVLLLTGCRQGENPEPVEGAETETADAPALTPVDTPPPEPEEPLLAGIAYADIEAALEPGAGCHIEQDGKNLLTAVAEDAIAKPYGTLRHFAFESAAEDPEGALDALWAGGVFTAGAIAVTVTPADGEGEQVEEVNIRAAEVRFAEEGQPDEQVFAATWRCGS